MCFHPPTHPPQAIVQEYKKITSVPSDPHEQLQLAIKAVFSSWFTPRAIKYRQYNDVPDDLGTAVTVQVGGWVGGWVDR